MPDMIRQSIAIILDHQSPTGAYLASPNFDHYSYCWFRDGAYTAYAMDLYGEHESAARFHAWAAGAIDARAEVVRRAVTNVSLGEPLGERDFLHTRYTLEGEATGKDWPNFQLDGFGTWLWSLAEHVGLGNKPLTQKQRNAAALTVEYLSALWRHPCFDCWEEFPHEVHAYTLGTIYGGLRGYASITDEDISSTIEKIRRALTSDLMHAGRFVKFLGSEQVDASLLGLATPYRVVEPNDGRMYATVERIERDLRRGGGVHRYAGDTYYGGGEWVLLTAWLGWHYAERGDFESARSLLAWVEAQADDAGVLPEQVAHTLNDPSQLEPWCKKWGQSARPLLWSHAMYLILVHALRGLPANGF